MRTYDVCTIDGTWHIIKGEICTPGEVGNPRDEGVVKFYNAGKLVALFPIESILALLLREPESNKSET